MMLTGLKLPIFCHNDETLNLKDGGVDYPLTECDVRTVIFYHIDALSPYLDEDDNNKEYCSIHTNDTEYISTLSVKEVQELLEAHLYRSLFFLKS